MKERVKHIAIYYGYDYQSRQCCEELAELIQAICKHSKMVDNDDFFVTTDTPEREHVLEEMADVRIMLDQMQYLLHISEGELDNAMDKKIKRQEKRIKELEDDYDLDGSKR